MSIDILDRLRAPSGGVVADTQIIKAARAAADEIERLRALIAEIERRVMFEGFGTGNTFAEAVERVSKGGHCPTVAEAYGHKTNKP